MQVLKDTVRKNIRNAAIKTFKANGFQKASMRTIAEEAGMSVGNLYRYYKNKETLFGELVQPMIDYFEAGRHEKDDKVSMEMLEVNLLEHSVFIEQLMEARLDFKDELHILFLCAEGSGYEGARATFRTYIEGEISNFLEAWQLTAGDIHKNDTYIKMIAASVTEAFCTNLELTQTDKEFLLNMLAFSELVVKPSIRNLIAIRDNKTSFRRISDEEIIRHFRDHRHRRHHCGTKGAEQAESGR